MSISIKKQKPLVRVAFRLDPDLEAEVSKLAVKNGVTQSDVYRHIMTTFFSHECKQNVDIHANS